MMEMALLSPWIIFMFIGALDWGFYAYSLITIETAARIAARTIAGTGASTNITNTQACNYVLPEVKSLSNIGTTVTSCGSAPLVVTATSTTSIDGSTAAVVSVTYTTPNMIPIPGLLAKGFTITRQVKMRVT